MGKYYKLDVIVTKIAGLGEERHYQVEINLDSVCLINKQEMSVMLNSGFKFYFAEQNDIALFNDFVKAVRERP